MLWTKDLKMNTVHVDDVCRAVWHLCQNGKNGEIYNIVDDGNTSMYRVNPAKSATIMKIICSGSYDLNLI